MVTKNRRMDGQRLWTGAYTGSAAIIFKTSASQVKVMVAKAKDDLFVSRKAKDVQNFMRELAKAFNVVKVSIGGKLRFMGCEVDIGDELVEPSMWD